VTVRRDVPAVFSLAEMRDLAEIVFDQGLLPVSLDTPQKAVIIMVAGRELGLGAMQSLRELYVVHGQVGMTAKLMGALYRSYGHSYTVQTRTAKVCTILFKPKGGVTQELTVTREECDAAGWTTTGTAGNRKEKPAWRTMPAVMLSYRCLSVGIRLYAAEVLQGFRTTDELGDEVTEDDPEEVINSTARDVTGSEPGAGDQEGEGQEGEPTNGGRPYPAAAVKARITELVDGYDGPKTSGKALQAAQRNLTILLRGTLPKGTAAQISKMRHGIMEYLCGVTSASELSAAMIWALEQWLLGSNGEGGEGAKAEVQFILNELSEAQPEVAGIPTGQMGF